MCWLLRAPEHVGSERAPGTVFSPYGIPYNTRGSPRSRQPIEERSSPSPGANSHQGERNQDPSWKPDSSAPEQLEGGAGEATRVFGWVARGRKDLAHRGHLAEGYVPCLRWKEGENRLSVGGKVGRD